MSPRIAFAAGLAAALAGCTLADLRSDPEVNPPGLLHGSDSVTFEIRAPSGARAGLRLDGADRGTVQVNEPVSLSLAGVPEGIHALQITVFDGPYPSRTIRRDLVVDRVPPRCSLSPPTAPYPPSGPFQVTVTCDEPLSLDSVQSATHFTGPFGPLPTTGTLSADGRGAVFTLGEPLESFPRVGLSMGLRDLAGNPVDPATAARVSWSAPVSPISLTAPAEVDGVLLASAALPPDWVGPTGPISLHLCVTDPGGTTRNLGGCSSVSSMAPGELPPIDTTGRPNGSLFLVASLPGARPTTAQLVLVRHHLVDVRLLASRTLTNGPIEIRVDVDGGVPPELELLANGAAIGRLPAPYPTGRYSLSMPWDAAVPDGTYELGARADDWQVSVVATSSVTVDRTPPVATPAWAPELDLTLDFTRDAASFSEPVTGTARFLRDGAPYADVQVDHPLARLSRPFLLGAAQPWATFTFEYDVSGLHDGAGNPAAPGRSQVTAPVWLAATGVAGPLVVGGEAVVAREATVLENDEPLVPNDARFAYVDAAGQVRAGRLSRMLPDPAGSPLAVASGLLTNGGQGSSGGFYAAWIEAVGPDQTAHVGQYHGSGVFLNPASVVASGASPLRSGSRFRPSDQSITWTEPDGAGGRVVRFRRWDGAQPDPLGGLPTTAVDAVEDCCVGTAAPDRHALLAWIDGAPAVPQLALSTSLAVPFDYAIGPWTPRAASLNADPSQAASSPALSGEHVAWLEADRIQAGRVVVDGPGVSFLHDAPASAAGARLPAFLDLEPSDAHRVLVFVEPGPGGDVIAARRWTPGGGWTALPPVNHGVAGDVRTLSVDGDTVTWTDAAGHVYARRLNR